MYIKNSEKIKALIKGCLQNDRECQKLLYKEYYSYGMSICLRFADHREEAAEILNDGFLMIFTHLKRFKTTVHFTPNGDKLLGKTSFIIHLKDFKVKIPKGLFYNIAESVDVKVEFNYEPFYE